MILQKRIIGLITIVLFLTSCVRGQNYTVEFKIKSYPQSPVMIMDYYGDSFLYSDTALTDTKGYIKFNFDENNPVGMYKIILGRTGSFDFIFNKEDISIETDYLALKDSLKVVKSKENKAFYEFVKKEAVFKAKMSVLENVLINYPEEDEFYEVGRTKFENEQLIFKQYLDEFLKSNESLFTSKLVNSLRPPMFDPFWTNKEKSDYLKAHFFDYVDFADTSLLHSYIFNNAIIDYLGLYRMQNNSKPEQEQAFIEAVDVIFSEVGTNEKIFEFVMNYLVRGFESFQFEEVLKHINKNYFHRLSCSDADKKSAIEKRLKGAELFSEGKPVPELKLPDISGKKHSLKDFSGKNVLLIFWSTECPHCTEMLPQIKKLYDKNKFEIIAVSLDDKKEPLEKYITENQIPWITLSDCKGWSSKVAEDFCIYATPTMFLLDKNHKIISKPISLRQLKRDLKNNNLL